MNSKDRNTDTKRFSLIIHGSCCGRNQDSISRLIHPLQLFIQLVKQLRFCQEQPTAIMFGLLSSVVTMAE